MRQLQSKCVSNTAQSHANKDGVGDQVTALHSHMDQSQAGNTKVQAQAAPVLHPQRCKPKQRLSFKHQVLKSVHDVLLSPAQTHSLEETESGKQTTLCMFVPSSFMFQAWGDAYDVLLPHFF